MLQEPGIGEQLPPSSAQPAGEKITKNRPKTASVDVENHFQAPNIDDFMRVKSMIYVDKAKRAVLT
jgi:hypothetical protein